ncbi:PRC-barrel domain-containing protein [Kozakia baliensis]|nr:PRC-barrel domain-containing protein [Kozakia baliensis]GBR32330.1 PRC-barrel protein [Kozakia baliensis NRIC 0488]GEL64523.1 photosystem reaction center subunit H [Kozakia baliensis]
MSDAMRDLTNETHDLIASDKVEGTAVYSRIGERLGTVRNFMVDKQSGHVAYAVMSFGGFLGIGDNYHPLPWKTLHYDPNQGGYVIDLTAEQLRDSPHFDNEASPDWNNAVFSRSIDEYYNMPGSMP